MIKLNVVVSVDIGKVDVPWMFHHAPLANRGRSMDVPLCPIGKSWMFHMLYVASYLLVMVGCMYSVMCVILLSVSLRVCGLTRW